MEALLGRAQDPAFRADVRKKEVFRSLREQPYRLNKNIREYARNPEGRMDENGSRGGLLYRKDGLRGRCKDVL